MRRVAATQCAPASGSAISSAAAAFDRLRRRSRRPISPGRDAHLICLPCLPDYADGWPMREAFFAGLRARRCPATIIPDVAPTGVETRTSSPVADHARGRFPEPRHQRPSSGG